MAAFPISAARAAELIPGEEVHPFRLGGDVGLLVVTVVDYRTTDIGSYIEFSIAIACTHGLEPAPALLPALLRGRYGTGQFVVDLPVSTEVSVKGGKGIWGMPKHQANLDFVDPQGQGLEPVRPRRPAVLPDRGGHAALDRPADEHWPRSTTARSAAC